MENGHRMLVSFPIQNGDFVIVMSTFARRYSSILGTSAEKRLEEPRHLTTLKDGLGSIVFFESTHVLFVKLEGPVRFIIYLFFRGSVTHCSIFSNQPMEIWDIYPPVVKHSNGTWTIYQ